MFVIGGVVAILITAVSASMISVAPVYVSSGASIQQPGAPHFVGTKRIPVATMIIYALAIIITEVSVVEGMFTRTAV